MLSDSEALKATLAGKALQLLRRISSKKPRLGKCSFYVGQYACLKTCLYQFEVHLRHIAHCSCIENMEPEYLHLLKQIQYTLTMVSLLGTTLIHPLQHHPNTVWPWPRVHGGATFLHVLGYPISCLSIHSSQPMIESPKCTGRPLVWAPTFYKGTRNLGPCLVSGLSFSID